MPPKLSLPSTVNNTSPASRLIGLTVPTVTGRPTTCRPLISAVPSSASVLMLKIRLKVPALVPAPRARFGLPRLMTWPAFQLRAPLPASDVALPSVDSHSAASVTEIDTMSVSLRGPLPVAPWSSVKT